MLNKIKDFPWTFYRQVISVCLWNKADRDAEGVKFDIGIGLYTKGW